VSDFATRLRELRTGRALRQKDLAVALGIAQTTIANYEQKLRFPDEPMLVKIADYFGVTLDHLIGRSNGAGGTDRDAAGGRAAEQAPGSPRQADGAHEALRGLARDYFLLLRDHDRDAAGARLRDAMRGGLSVQEMYLDALAPALREVGRLWALGEMSVADEHEFSEATQRIMSSLLPVPLPPPSRRLRCVVVPASGELHLVGARMVADFLSLAGLDTRFSGGDLSIGQLKEMLLASPPDLLALSVTLHENVNAAADTIAALRARRELGRMRIMAGGQAFNARPDLWSRIGAHATAVDAAEAVRAVLRLFPEKD